MPEPALPRLIVVDDATFTRAEDRPGFYRAPGGLLVQHSLLRDPASLTLLRALLANGWEGTVTDPEDDREPAEPDFSTDGDETGPGGTPFPGLRPSTG